MNGKTALDYFGLYIPGELQSMLQGRMGPLGPVTQKVQLGTSVMMSIPSVMIFLSVAMRPAVIEIALTVLVVFYAWTWPRQVSE